MRGKKYKIIKYNNLNTSFQKILWGVLQGSVLGPLLFLIYVNHLQDASKCLDSIMFADDTIFFYSYKNIKGLSYTINSELEKIAQWFKANKLSINIKKAKFTLFHENSFKEEIPLKLPALMIGNNNFARKS